MSKNHVVMLSKLALTDGYGHGSLGQFDQNNMIYCDDKRYDWAIPTKFAVPGERLIMTIKMILH